MRIARRIENIESIARVKHPTLPTFHCIIDGEPAVMTVLDFCYAVHYEGRQGEMLDRAGDVQLDPIVPGELDRIMDELTKKYNSPEAIAKRQADYEELQRIGALRRQDFYAGRNMDECHPLPW